MKKKNEEDEESVKIMFYLYFIPGVTFSSSFLQAVTFLHVLHLDVLKRQIQYGSTVYIGIPMGGPAL